MTKNEKKSFNQSLAEWKLFIYNPTTGEFLGRTAKSWGERAGRRAGAARAPRAPPACAAAERTRPHSFPAGPAGPVLLPAGRGVGGCPGLTVSSARRSGAHVRPGFPPRAAPEAGDPRRAGPRAFGAEPGLLCTEPAGPGRGSRRAELLRDARPAPRLGRGNFHSRRYLVTRPRRHPDGSQECE
ncbi:Hypothetical predicted protein [Marmota monax]|uniref:Uncharacterized protein n=1 Tax=Marmota monax TaxID=9995 RepID=A0A5E4CSW8_MARMO|nr:hypothetical protein GHT09_003923 [Marmota monax]VTJ84884.1 Hypothetical predicted protein [Marmota monax]